jgi:predicted dehydrogenase
MPSHLNRRRFLRRAAGAAAAVSLAGTLPAAERKASPNERINVAVIGVAGRGADNLAGVSGENVVALCDVDEGRAAAARAAHPRARFFQDFRRVFDLKGVDAVVVSTPDHTHALPSLMAMRAGKHLYCEKPLAHGVHEVRLMREAAARHKVVTQMGTQIHAGDNYRRVVELVRAGVIGQVGRVQVWCEKRPDPRSLAKKPAPVPAGLAYDLWLGPAPARPYDPAFLPFHWRWFWEFGGGILADMACHYMDLAHWALDLRIPVAVAADGKKLGEGDQPVPDVLRVDYRYPARGQKPPVHLSWFSGCVGPDLAAAAAFHGFRNGVLFEGTEGKLLADYGRYVLLPEEKFRGLKPPTPSIPPSVGHHKEWLDAIRTGGPTTCNFDYSGALAETVLLGNVAFRSGASFAWDEAAGRTDSAAANLYLRRQYRKGWEL